MTKGRREVRDFVGADEVADFEPRYKVSPGTEGLVIRQRPEGRLGELLRWGFGGGAGGRSQINARAESAFAKRAFAEAARARRCLIPVSGFFEPRGRRRAGREQYYFEPADRQLLALAGIWSGGATPGFAILTTRPNAVVGAVHARMPAILAPAQFDAWLDPALEDEDRLTRLLEASPDPGLTGYRVTEKLYALDAGDPACLDPAAQGRLF